MKKLFLALFLLSAFGSLAQVKLGLKLAPVITANRATNDSLNIDENGSKVKFSIGLVLDKQLSETYFLSSGLIYLPKRVAYINADRTVAEEYTLQYLQIPISLKLFTNEIAPDLKPYIQVGSGLEFKVFDEPKDPSFVNIQKFHAIDIPVIIGAGIEYRAVINTTLFGGFSYQRGLINTVSEATAGFEDLQIRNTIFSIDLGLKF